MAAPSGIIWGDIAGNNRGRIGIYTSVSNTDTQTTVNVEVWLWTRYSAYDSTNTLYYDCGVGVTAATTSVGSVSFNHSTNSSWSTNNQTKIYTKSYTHKRTTSAQTFTIYSKLQGVDWVGAVMHAKTNYIVPALATYTVSYDANGGTGAPAAQTKWHGVYLTLSNTKPVRTGYTFVNWLSSVRENPYTPNETYGFNQSTTMVAQWQANTYTINYDANGGSGAPSAQAKTHDVALALSSAIPTKTNYNFIGWATSASATTATYSAGGSYTANTPVTLYAVWELAYIKPRITGLSVERCDANGTLSDIGTFARVSFDWATDYDCVEIVVSWAASADNGAESFAASGRSGSVSGVVGGNISAETAYIVTVLVSDGNGSTSVNTTLSGTAFAIDFLAGGKGVAFGKPAEKEGLEIAFDTVFSSIPKVGEDALALAKDIGGGDFAPAGYGLGTTTTKTVTSVAALNDLTAGGWYFFALSGTTINNVTFNYASVFVCPTNAKTSCYQELRPLATNYVLRRYLHSGTWSDWEIDNPPLMPGLEYKTSERWHGAAIYRKLIYYGISSQTGSTSGNTDITVAHGVSNMEHLIRASAMRNRYTSTAKGYTLPYHSSSGGSIAITHNDATNIYIRFYKDYLGGGTIYIDLAYTKG